ncbi:MAG TPA: type II toxin-antitoxin system VapC family toxin [Pirellulales bacterium]|jgi:predicted nucleic acid-binding protein|nr:type II toxin-antitoxin system VapC family toxin [Pirellulales bacterium]
MAGSFLDTSALAKHYHLEPGSDEIDRQWADSARFLFISRVGVVEAISVFAGNVRTGDLSAPAFTLLRKRFLNDVGSGRPKLVRLLVNHFKEADRLIGRHGLARRIRTLDALQLAVALDLNRRAVIDQLVSSDKQLLSVAVAEGIPVLDTENP